MSELTNYVDLQPAREIGPEQLKKLTQILQQYKTDRQNTEQRILASENWWKLRNTREESRDSNVVADNPLNATSGWLHNVIVSKHADLMEAYPEPTLLPREEGDKAEAHILSSIIPLILEENDYEQTYNEACWQILKTGTSVQKVTWSQDKLNGLGDIQINKVNLLNLYWEAGITDIQQSRYVFHTELVDRDVFVSMHPEIPDLNDKLRQSSFFSTKFLYDDKVSVDGKVTVIDVYYHKYVNKRKTLQYIKYVNDIVISATENDPELAQRGLYDHGMYPYVVTQLFPIEGSICGYGFVDLCRSPQLIIDMLNSAFVENAMAGSIPRYFFRSDGSVNEQEFLDLRKRLVRVEGNLGEDSLREIPHNNLDGVYVNFLDRVIQELRETSGNTETATGSSNYGVTAASGIAALQEAAGKGSRDLNLSIYRSFRRIINFVVELIRQFYDLPRQFRIVGEYGQEEFVEYTNKGIVAQHQGVDQGVDMGYRLPVFDIKVVAAKRSAYSKVSQNELAIQFFKLGFFNPQMTDQALMCLGMMDFDGKDEIIHKISQQGTMFEKLCQYMQLALQLSALVRPDMVQGLAQDIQMTMGGGTPTGTGALPQLTGASLGSQSMANPAERPFMQNARANAIGASQPAGGAITKEATE